MPYRSNPLDSPDHVAIHDEQNRKVTSGTVGNDGRFNLTLHEDINGLAAWCRNLQKSLKQPQKNPGKCSAAREQPANGAKPRLNIAMHIIGSRGDVQPFIPIAQTLSKPPFGHRVRICTHPAFKEFVEAQGIEFFSIGGDPESLMAYMVKNPGLLPKRESVKAGEVAKRRSEMWEIINGCWRSCIEAGNGLGEPVMAAKVPAAEDLFLADLIVANPPSMAHIHCAEKLGIPLHMVFTMPWSPTEAFSHPLAFMNDAGQNAKVANYLSFVVMELLTWQGLGDLINKFRRQKLSLDPISPMWGFQLLTRLQVPFTYIWSNSLIPKPGDWGSNINVTGFSFLPLANSYTPPADLTAFLEKGPGPIYVGFGSIVVDDAEALTRLVFKAVEIAGVRAIVSRGWSGVGGRDVPDNIYLIGNSPHDWLFRRVSAVVHHGGAGTTAASIAAGVPTIIVPFFGDQPFWGNMVSRAGAGPDALPFKELTAETLAARIQFALQPKVRKAAQAMAKLITQEDGAMDTAKDLEDRLDLDRFQCDLAPGRLATHRHKRTGLYLSGFAVFCLLDQRIIQPREVRLLQHKEWYVDEGAEHPLVGLVAAFTSFVATVATATSDYAQVVRSQPRKTKPESQAGSDLDSPAAKDNEVVGTNNFLAASSHATKSPLERAIQANTLAPKELEFYAQKMAKKSLKSADPADNVTGRQPSFYNKRKASWQAREHGQNGHAFRVTRATGRYITELTKAGLKAPVACFYNVANGFHNFPSHGFAGIEVRRRSHITGLGSGITAAGTEFTLGLWDALSGVLVQPYKSVKDKGVKGVGPGIWRGGKGFFFNIGAAIFGVPGYILKGMEKELQKHHVTKARAEIFLIRIRQGLDDFERATAEEREEVVRRWRSST